MNFIDLKTQYQRIKPQVQQRINDVFEHGQFIMGPEIAELEAGLADMTQAKHCISVSNGTDALVIAMMALGIKPGDEIITPAFTYFATVETIMLLGAKPVVVDIDPNTYNINPDLIEAKITAKTKAIIPVSLYGQCADFTRINAIAEKHGLPVIEDAAQSFGATHHGKASCNLSTIATTSFFPAKPLGAYGDAGACFTNDDALAALMNSIRLHGEEGRYNHARLGLNGRMDTMQAAMMLPKLDIYADEMERRQQVATCYREHLLESITTPFIESYNLSAYAQFTIQVDNREALRECLSAEGIPTAIHYPKPVTEQPAFQAVMGNVHGDIPISEAVAKRVMSLPFHPYLEADDVKKIADIINQFVS